MIYVTVIKLVISNANGNVIVIDIKANYVDNNHNITNKME